MSQQPPAQHSQIRRSLAKRKKLVLLRSSLRRGAGAFCHQVLLTMEDMLLRRRHLVFRLDAATARQAPPGASSHCEEISSWEDLPADLRARLTAPGENLEWGHRDWFEKRRLWALTQDNQIAALCWTLITPERDGFFCEVPASEEVIYQTVVLPEFRGQGLQRHLYESLVNTRIEQGKTGFFVSCHAYNHTSRRNIERLGFRLIGHRTDHKIFKTRRWHEASLQR